VMQHTFLIGACPHPYAQFSTGCGELPWQTPDYSSETSSVSR
jgi:hypothetical protein